jgi:hypothetical protein
MNTVKKIKLSTLFALALIGQSGAEVPFDINIMKSRNAKFNDSRASDYSILHNAKNSMYSPINTQMTAEEYIRNNVQNTSQSADINNKGTFQNEMNFDNMNSSDIMGSFTNNSSAMNSNGGSTYNDSNNRMDTEHTNNSKNTSTHTVDNGRSYFAFEKAEPVVFEEVEVVELPAKPAKS